MEEMRKQAESKALARVNGIYTHAELEAVISQVREDPMQEQAMRTAAAKQITSSEAQRVTEHRLQRFADLLEPNPRSMKRLVNAYGLHQATHFLERRSVSPEALARWTIIELRWPLLADFLAVRPQLVSDLAKGETPTSSTIPADLTELFGDEEVKRVVIGNGDEPIMALDEAAVRGLVGLARA